MNLGQLRLEVRRALHELEADLFSDNEINDWLNEAAKIMVSNAQPVQAIHQFTTVASQQEYLLPVDLDEIFNVTHYDTGVNNLRYVQPNQVQIGGDQTGVPGFFYIRNQALKTGQMTSTGLTVADANMSDPGIARTVIGLFPVPSAAKQVTVFYYSRHGQMQNDGAIPMVPPEFRRGLVCYAVALGKEKESAYAEADRHRKMFQDFSDRLREKMICDGQDMGFPCVELDDDQPMYGDVIIKFGTAS